MLITAITFSVFSCWHVTHDEPPAGKLWWQLVWHTKTAEGEKCQKPQKQSIYSCSSVYSNITIQHHVNLSTKRQEICIIRALSPRYRNWLVFGAYLVLPNSSKSKYQSVLQITPGKESTNPSSTKCQKQTLTSFHSRLLLKLVLKTPSIFTIEAGQTTYDFSN